MRWLIFGTIGLLYLLLVVRMYKPYTYLQFDTFMVTGS